MVDKDAVRLQRRTRGNGLISSITDEIKSFDPEEAAVALAWLAILAPRVDGKGETYLSRSLDLLDINTRYAERKVSASEKWCHTAETVTSVVGSRFPDSQSRLKKFSSCQSDREEQQRIEDIIGLIDREETEKAATLWNDGFSFGYKSYSYIHLIVRFRYHSPQTADALYLRAIHLAATSIDLGLHTGLAYVTFPESESASMKEVPIPPQNLRTEYLSNLAQIVLTQSQESDNCELRQIAGRLLPLYEQLLPSLSGPISVNVKNCLGSSKGSVDAANDDPPNIGDLIKKAEQTIDHNLRFERYLEAALLTSQKGDLAEAIRILDLAAPSSDQSQAWNQLRADYTGELAYRLLAQNDLSHYRKTIERSPPHLKALIKLSAFRRVPSERKTFIQEQMRSLQSEIAVADQSTRIQLFSSAIEVAESVLPSESLPYFRLLCNALEEVDGSLTGIRSPNTSSPYSMVPFQLPTSFVDTEFDTSIKLIAGLKSPIGRTYLKLGLLSALNPVVVDRPSPGESKGR